MDRSSNQNFLRIRCRTSRDTNESFSLVGGCVIEIIEAPLVYTASTTTGCIHSLEDVRRDPVVVEALHRASISSVSYWVRSLVVYIRAQRINNKRLVQMGNCFSTPKEFEPCYELLIIDNDDTLSELPMMSAILIRQRGYLDLKRARHKSINQIYRLQL